MWHTITAFLDFIISQFVTDCNTHAPLFPEFRTSCEDSHALRLTSELADLLAANANRILPPAAAEHGAMKGE